MTVADLIKELSQFNKDTEIYIQKTHEDEIELYPENEIGKTRTVVEYQSVSYFLDSESQTIFLTEYEEEFSSKLLSTVEDLIKFLQWFRPEIKVAIDADNEIQVCEKEVCKEECGQLLGRWHTCRFCKHYENCLLDYNFQAENLPYYRLETYSPCKKIVILYFMEKKKYEIY